MVETFLQFDFSDGEAGVISFYALTHAFETFRADGTSIGRWTMSNAGDLFEDSWSSGGGAPPSSPPPPAA